MRYTIAQVAERVGVTASTLRYYDKEGLLPFVDRSAGGIRMFKDTDFEWLQLIECLKVTGMPIKDIRQFIDWYMEGDCTLRQRRDMFYERKRVVQEQIEALNKTLDMINFKCRFYDTKIDAGEIDAPQQIQCDDIPKDLLAIKQRLEQK